MLSEFMTIRPACDFKGVVPADVAFIVEGGLMQARNNQLAVSQPTQLPDFIVPAIDLDFALKKVGESAVSVGRSFITLKSTQGKAKIRRLETDRRLMEKPVIETRAVSDVGSFLEALQDVLPFTEGDTAKTWSMGARIDDYTITATNGIMLIQAQLDDKTGFTSGITLPRAVLQYLLARGELLVSWGCDSFSALFEFSDGSWAHASRLNPEMPDHAVSLINNIKGFDEVAELTKEYKEALLACCDYADDIAYIYPDHVTASNLSTEFKRDVSTELADPNKPAIFTAKQLKVVIEAASAVNFSAFPGPVPFETALGSRGLIAGRM